MTDAEAAGAVYVVLSHRGRPQVQRLAGAILASSPRAHVIVMHDARREPFPTAPGDDRIEVITHGLASDWGSWELVEAALLGFERARTAHDAQLVILISGDDYPVRRLPEWEREALAADSWIGEARPLRYRPHWGRRRGEGDDRWTRYAYRWFRSPVAERGVRMPPRVDRVWIRVRAALALRLEPVLAVRIVSRGRGLHYGIRRLRSRFSAQHPCWLGAQWVALRRHELDRLLDVDLVAGSSLRRVYEHSIIPDESGLVTPLSWIRPPAALPPVSHLRWDDASDRSLTWTIDDLDTLIASGSPFCRKVDAVHSTELMDALDRLTSSGVTNPGEMR